MRAVAPPGRVAWGVPLLAPLVLGYRSGIVPGSVIRAAAVRLALSGVREAAAREAARHFCDQVIAASLLPVAMQRIAWHQARGDTVVVVSGAFDLYLSHFCRAHGLGLICSALEVERGLLTGRYRGAQCVGAEKARRVRDAYDLSGFARVYAYGDTREDRDLLALAHERHYRWQQVR